MSSKTGAFHTYRGIAPNANVLDLRVLDANGSSNDSVVIAAIQKDKTELAKESADVLYHLAVLWAASGLTPDDVYAVLKAREGQSGLEEKASRPKS